MALSSGAAAGFAHIGVLAVLEREGISITRYQAVRSSLIGADVVIEPRLLRIGFGDWHRAQESILQGEVVTQESIPEIKRYLNAKNF